MALLQIFDPKARPTPIGIDLGTTNSLVAWVFDGAPQCVLDCDSCPLLPSVVHYLSAGGVVVGGAAAGPSSPAQDDKAAARATQATMREVLIGDEP